MSKSGNTLLALITGAAIGAGIGILYAPDRGDKTRKKLQKNAKKQQEKLAKQLNETRSNLTDTAKKARANFEVKLNETLSNASYKADDIIVSLENKLEDLRKQNAKLQMETKTNKVEAKVDHAKVKTKEVLS